MKARRPVYRSLFEWRHRLLFSPRTDSYATVVVFEDLYGNKWDLLQPARDAAHEDVRSVSKPSDVVYPSGLLYLVDNIHQEGTMKLPSIQHLLDQSTKTFLRFPFPLTSAAVGTMAWLILIERDDHGALGFLESLTFVGMLGISLFTGIKLVCEKFKTTEGTLLFVNVGGVALLGAYYFSLPGKILDANIAPLIRYTLFAAGLHFFVAVGPFLKRGEVNGFWHLNKSLFLRFLTASLYSAALFFGLMAAIIAVDKLFDAHIDNKIYLELWVFLVGMFNTWFFLAGLPEDLDKLESETEYPKGLKIFTQYVLIPLVFIYLVILYAYEVKIIAEMEWPKGWVGYLVLGFSILGILSLLLVHPIKERVENAWIRVISKYYYAILIPLVGLLLPAIWRRISEYGLTERRYFVVVLSLWLAAMIVYFLLSRTKSIKVIPATLCGIAFLVSFGPWGAMSMSERNQVGRLTEVLTRNGILKDGKIHKATEKIVAEDCRKISSIIRYLAEVHGWKAIQPWFDFNLDTVGVGRERSNRYSVRYNQPREIVAFIGVTYLEDWQESATKSISFQSSSTETINIRGYSHLVQNVSITQWDSVKTISAEGFEWVVGYNAFTSTMTLSPKSRSGPAFRFDLKPMISGLEEQYGLTAYSTNIPSEKMSLEQDASSARVRIRFRTINGQKIGDRYQANYLQADVLIGPGK
ncbi:MAG: DUF4153 domain-containing protein [Bacteroidota bacterium]